VRVRGVLGTRRTNKPQWRTVGKVCFMSTSIEPSVALGESTESENLGLLLLAVERKHDRTAVLRRRTGAAWQDTPDWRFQRQAMRIALYLKERGQLTAGDRVAIVSRLCPEWTVVQWAALTQGMATAAIDPTLPDAELCAHLAALAPRAVFVDGDSLNRTLACLESIRGVGAIVVWGGPGGGQALSWSEVIDLGGSLDTAERANALRAQARAVPPETPALGHAVGTNGSVAWRFLSHREVVRRVQRVWARSRIARGDVAYVAGGMPSLATSVACLAFTADGYTQVVVGEREHELEDIAMTRPHKIIASVETVRRMLESPARARSSSRVRHWLARAPFLRAALRAGNGGAATSAHLERARWMSTGPALALSMRARARKRVTLEIDDSLV
jgi:long-subunit acyl-CoA synthetase (AMP-forming)